MPLEIFISYSHEDQWLRTKLETHLASLQRTNQAVFWHDGRLVAGQTWTDEIRAHLETADIILMLVSADFLASDFCYQQEMTRALERHDAGTAVAIPIIVRPVSWQRTPLGRLQALPAGAKPITSWPNQDEAFADVANRLRDAIVGRAALKPWLTPAESPDIDARLSVLVSDQHQELRVVGDPGATPVHRGARLQVQVTLNRPAYVYVLWVTSGAIVQPLYPWSPGDWDRYPPHATQIARSHLVLPEPDPATGPGTWSIDSDQGAETAVLLVRERPLAGDAAAALPHALAAVPSARLTHPDNVLRCEYRRRAATEMTSTRVAFDFEPTDTPFAQHTFLRTRLENRFPLMHIVSFGNAGDHRHAGP